jgi:iduronate 2-sulfatase
VEWKVPGANADTAEFELYDYVSDPAETKNLVEQQPEVAAELRNLLEEQGEATPPLTPAG